MPHSPPSRGIWSGFVGGREVLCAACNGYLWELERQENGQWGKTACGAIDTLSLIHIFRRMDWLENQMVTESGRATGCMNALKQEKNGGYADKAGAGAEKRLVIRLEGVGSGAAE